MMFDHSASLAALGPGLAASADDAINLRAFAQRRVDHLRKKLEAGEIDAIGLQRRLISRFGNDASEIVSEDGAVDFTGLQDLIAARQAVKLQGRLEGFFGQRANGIVGDDGEIDRERLRSLQDDHAGGTLTTLLGDRLADAIKADGSICIHRLREFLMVQENELLPQTA